MPLTAGTRFGPYDVVARIGEGGMGEVYRARDTRLDRDVALKVLPDAVASDPERIARFEREAKTLAALNHPHIAQIYGLEDTPGCKALVMEYVDGPTLAERIDAASGRPAPGSAGLPLDEALAIARQVAEALEAAHDAGIIHRDLKPANVKVRPDGTVKVLDFGLAKALEPAGTPSANVSRAPTITSPAMTQAGVVLGTAAYMSPEQAKGRAADRRSDVWAFGCVLYEMLTGARTFGRDDVAETLAAVLMKEPDWARLPRGTPAPIHRLLRRCLEKDRRRRLADIADARLEIDDAGSALVAARSDDSDRAPVARPAPSKVAWVTAAALGIVAAGLVLALVMARPDAPELAEIRLEIATPPTGDPMSLAASPDGRSVAFVGIVEGRSQILVRSLGSSAAQPLGGTVGAAFPFWSPDGGSIGFFADGKLNRIDMDTGLITTLADTPTPSGGTWGADGTIVYVPALLDGLMRVPASGGQATTLRGVGVGQQRYRDPRFLPDGRNYSYFVFGVDDVRGVYAGGPDVEPKRILDGDVSGPAVVAGGFLFFVRQESLFAHPFDGTSLVPTGRPVLVAEGVGVDGNGRAAFAVSGAGTIVYRSGAVGRQKQLTWFDRSGNRLGVAGGLAGSHTSPSLSPDARQVAHHQTTDGNTDIWLFDLDRNFPSRFTSNPLSDIYAVWSPDSTELVFSAFEDGRYNLYRKRVMSTGSPELLLSSAENKIALDWSRDGRFLLYGQISENTRSGIWALSMESDRKAVRVLDLPGNVPRGQFSPDGRWLAYESAESGRSEVYVQPFPGPGARTQVSTAGGAQVRWRRDGREIFYIDLAERLTAVSVPVASGDTFRVSAPVALFQARLGGAVPAASSAQYMVSADGRRFLMDTVVDEGPPSPISVILHWKP